MATNTKHLYLGAPDQIIVDYNSASQLDLGSSEGGATLDYKPKYFQAEVDQALGPVTAWRTGEETVVTVELAEQQVNRMLAVMSYSTSGDTTATATTLGICSPATAATNGTPAATSYSYQIFAFTSQGDGIPSTAVVDTTGPTTLTAINSITLTLPALPSGAIGFGVIRSASAGTGTSGTTGLLFRLAGNATTFTDTGFSATTYTASIAQPTTNAWDTASVGGTVTVPTHQLDLAAPVNVGTTSAHIRYRFGKVYLAGSPQLAYKKDKNTTYKAEFAVLTDPTLTAGAQMFTWWIES